MIQLIPMNALIVSIHAPTRGATISIPSFILGFDSSFNPRTHTGCDATFVGYALIRFRFQSTHPHGVRQFRQRIFKLTETFQSTHPHGVRRRIALCWSITQRSFNPRTHTGCDFDKDDLSHLHALFQSTHPHGVRRLVNNLLNKRYSVSIHAPTRGATLYHQGGATSYLVSIHAPTRGATFVNSILQID